MMEAENSPDLTGQPEDWFGEEVRTEGGGVDSIFVGDRSYTGKEMRSRL